MELEPLPLKGQHYQYFYIYLYGYPNGSLLNEFGRGEWVRFWHDFRSNVNAQIWEDLEGE